MVEDYLNTNFANNTNIIILDFQMDFLWILSGATILNEYLFARFERFVFVFFNTNCTNNTNIILLDFQMVFLRF